MADPDHASGTFRALPPGTVLAGRFRVVRLLGAGNMGAVYEIEHEITKHRRALKLLHAHAAASPEVVARFLREASAAGRIGDPHIVETFDAGSLDSGEPYVVMELLDGRTLGSRLAASGRLDLAEIGEIVAQACDAAQVAHDAGIVHRDLKPENLFLTKRSGRVFVKLLDFGVSKFAPHLTGGAAVTRDGQAMGTPLYMAPEQLFGEPDLDGRVDVYALGVILYECAAGQPPFQTTSLAQLATLAHEGKLTPLSKLRPDLPPAFTDLVARAMAPQRAARVPTARALAEALRAVTVDPMADTLLETASPLATRTSAPEVRVSAPTLAVAPAPAPPPSRRAPVIVAAIAIVLGAIVAAWISLR